MSGERLDMGGDGDARVWPGAMPLVGWGEDFLAGVVHFGEMQSFLDWLRLRSGGRSR